MDLSQMISRSYTHFDTQHLCHATILGLNTGLRGSFALSTNNIRRWNGAINFVVIEDLYGRPDLWQLFFFGWQLPMLRIIKFKTLFHVSTHCSVNRGRWWFPVRWKSSLGTLWHDKRHGVMGRCVFEENPHMFCVLISSMYICMVYLPTFTTCR